MKRIKSLDGIRAMCIIAVFFTHALDTIPIPVVHDKMLAFFITNAGHLGVKIFFVISGFLITKLLLLEREKNGKIDIKDFYIRRMMRILPVFFLYILVILILKWTLIPDIFSSYSLVLFAVCYIWDYKHMFTSMSMADHGHWFFGHFWTLSIEEQFYLFWPLIFTRLSQKSVIRFIIGAAVVIPILRLATFLFIPQSKMYADMMLHTSGDNLLIGCLGAIIERSAYFKNTLLKYIQNRPLGIANFCLLFLVSPFLSYRFEAPYNLLIGYSLNTFSIMFFLYWTIYVPSWFSSILNTRVFIWIGVLSYSLYVWQQLFLTNINKLWVNQFPQNIIISVLVASASYYLIEKPVLRLKKKFSKV